MVQKFCLVCTPRSGSYYLLDHIARYFDLENGKEWFGRVKKVYYEGLRTSPVDIDHSVNEGLLTNKEMSLRLLYLKNYPTPFIIKCMPFQITKTIERDSMPYEESQEIAAKYMKNFSLIYMETRDKIPQFCFDVISKNQDYVRRNLTSYDPMIREIPKPQSLTATKEHFISFMERQNYVKAG
jgi:xylose isomerase